MVGEMRFELMTSCTPSKRAKPDCATPRSIFIFALRRTSHQIVHRDLGVFILVNDSIDLLRYRHLDLVFPRKLKGGLRRRHALYDHFGLLHKPIYFFALAYLLAKPSVP